MKIFIKQFAENPLPLGGGMNARIVIITLQTFIDVESKQIKLAYL